MFLRSRVDLVGEHNTKELSEDYQHFQSHEMQKEVEESPESEDPGEYVFFFFIIIILIVIVIFNLNTFPLSHWTYKYNILIYKYKFSIEIDSFLSFPQIHCHATNRVHIELYLG